MMSSNDPRLAEGVSLPQAGATLTMETLVRLGVTFKDVIYFLNSVKIGRVTGPPAFSL